MTRNKQDFCVVTGAFGYSGQYMAKLLLDVGKCVRTLTASPGGHDPFAGAVEAHPYSFDRPDKLAESLAGASVLINTYWVRFDHAKTTHAEAVQNTLKLFAAAQRAGVERIVHISIANPSLDSDLPYFRGKAELELALRDSGVSYAILRPTVLFGQEDILINNIAWILRHFPFFGVFGDGLYKLRPVFVGDLAKAAVECANSRDNLTLDAVGPETFTYRELVTVLGRAVGREARIVCVPPWLGLLAGRVIGALVGDVVITADEITGLMQNLLVTNSPAIGPTSFSEWVTRNRGSLGRHYRSELARRRVHAHSPVL